MQFVGNVHKCGPAPLIPGEPNGIRRHAVDLTRILARHVTVRHKLFQA